MNIPDFKNTEEALSFGKTYQGNKEVINQLKIRYALIKARAQELMKEDKPDQACFLISGQGQFAREAFEEAEQHTEQSNTESTFSRIFQYVLTIFDYIMKILLWLFSAVFGLIMFLAMLICGIMGFRVFMLFMAFMLYACCIAIIL